MFTEITGAPETRLCAIKSFIRLLLGMQPFKIVMGTGSSQWNETDSALSESQVLTSLQEDIAYETHLTTFMAQIYLFPNKKKKYS